MKHALRKLMSLQAVAGALAVLLAAAAFLAVDAAAPDYRSTPGEVLTVGPTIDELAQLGQNLHASVAEEIPAGVLGAPILVNLTADERRDLRERELATAHSGPAVVGRTKPVNAHVRFSDLDSKLSTKPRKTGTGFAQLTPDGGFAWAVALRSEDAAGLRLHVRGLDLPDAAEMYWMNPGGEIFGYRGRGPNDDGDFWTNTISGAEGVLVVRHYGPEGPVEMQQARFVIADLGHVSPAFADVLVPSTEAFCSYNATCVINASCAGTDPPAEPAKNAVARMQWISGQFINTCTGGLLMDTATTTPPARHFLTANHCLSTNGVASGLETFFQYSVACNAACPGQLNPGGTRILGATVQSTNSVGDYTLLLLSSSGTLPTGTVFLGWNSSPIAFTNGADLFRISHPAFGPQAYSRHDVDTSAPTCTGWPRGQRIYSRDVEGATEGGSSGSPVLNGSSQVVGQLSGACGFNPSNPCDDVNNATVDGAFASYFSSISSILDNAGGGCTPTQNPETSCSDGLDNDCDTLIDAADPDCTPTCSPAGASCTTNSQCCSNRCRGKAGSKTCR